MVNGAALGSIGWVARSVIRSRAHFTVSARDLAALTHRDGELRVRSPNFDRGLSEVPGQSLETKRELSVLVKLWDDWYGFVGGNLSLLSLEHFDPSLCLPLTRTDSPEWWTRYFKDEFWYDYIYSCIRYKTDPILIQFILMNDMRKVAASLMTKLWCDHQSSLNSLHLKYEYCYFYCYCFL